MKAHQALTTEKRFLNTRRGSNLNPLMAGDRVGFGDQAPAGSFPVLDLEIVCLRIEFDERSSTIKNISKL